MRTIHYCCLTVGAAAFLAFGGYGVASAASASTPAAKPGSLYGCVNGSSRVLEHAYTIEKNFNGSAGCGKTGFPVTIAGGAGYNTEVDNGTEFTVSDSPALADTSAASATYADAGVVVDVGPTSSLTTASIAYKGTGTLAENIWIGDGPQASTPGVYPLADADFCYGLGSGSGATAMFDMQSDCGTYAGQTLTLADVKKDFPSLEAYAWVGVVSSGSAVGPSTVTSVGSQTVGAKVGVLANTGGTLTPYVS